MLIFWVKVHLCKIIPLILILIYFVRIFLSSPYPYLHNYAMTINIYFSHINFSFWKLNKGKFLGLNMLTFK